MNASIPSAAHLRELFWPILRVSLPHGECFLSDDGDVERLRGPQIAPGLRELALDDVRCRRSLITGSPDHPITRSCPALDSTPLSEIAAHPKIKLPILRRGDYKMNERTLTIADIMLIAGTRVAVGAGIGLLISTRLNNDQRKAAGISLAVLGGLTTIPLMLKLRGEHGHEELRRAA